MALHLLLVIVLGSIIIPPTARRALPALLWLSFSEAPPAPPETTVLLASSQDLPAEGGDAGDRTELRDGNDESLSEKTRDPLTEFADASAPPSAAVEEETELGLLLTEATPISDQAPRVEQQVAASGLPGAARAARIPPPAPEQAETALQTPLPEAAAEEEKRLDDIVNRFIEFDVGRLQGEAGEKAKRSFDHLGPESIPALVRGLNKSAKIYASCPVVVISNKLSEAMDHNQDPTMLQYVAEHLGEQVPKNAPHLARIQALKSRLLHDASDAREETEPDLVALLVKRLNGTNLTDRLEATRAIIQRAAEIPAEGRSELAWALIRRLPDRHPELKRLVHHALTILADGEDFGPDQTAKASAKETAAAASRWYAHFDQRRYEAMAASVMASAKHFEDVRRKSSAARYYRKVIEEYAGTRAADAAAERLKALSEFELR
ncbi:MAG TPA: hypothetical protein VHC19_12830 [Pirellulales bacterium]|nr:hypothetical protein [Pirellulales bacterium]